jgi:crotonobetainyl-CoA:carnitine CoA-transferase CaiB-like acyl-CoA transferase
VQRPDDRGRHAAIISERMGRWCAERTSDEIVQILGDAMIPCAPVLKPQQTLDHPQDQAIGVLQDTDYPGLPRPAPVAAVPLWMTETQAVPRRRPPTLGEHTEQVLGELGYSAQDIVGFRERSVI